MIEIESNQVFSIDQDSVIPRTKKTFSLDRCFVPNHSEGYILKEGVENLNSPIQDVFFPYDWDYSFGLILENDCVLHEGFALDSNSLMIYKASQRDLPDFVFLSDG